MNLKPCHRHIWIQKPYTAYEIRRELRVRESKHTVMLFDKKYFDVDTQKYQTDKLQTINSYSLGDGIDDGRDSYINIGYGHVHSRNHVDNQLGVSANSPLFNIPKFVPKDDDFDIEEKKVKELKAQQEREEKKRLREEEAERELHAKIQAAYDEEMKRRRKLIEKMKENPSLYEWKTSKNSWVPK